MRQRLNILEDSMAREDILEAIVEGPGRTIFLPNVDHLVRMRRLGTVRPAYASNAFNLIDGRPLFFASRLLRKGFLYYPGADLLADLVHRYGDQPLKVGIVGGSRARQEARLREIAPGWSIEWDDGFYDWKDSQDPLKDPAFRPPDAQVILMFMGFPKQEWAAAALRAKGSTATIICLGAALDFLVQAVPRSPPWMTKAGLEWLHRLARDPFRLGRRYVVDAVGLPLAFARMWRARRSRLGTPPPVSPRGP